MNEYVFHAILRLTKYFVAIHCILYLEIVALLCSAIYNIRAKRKFSLYNVVQIVCDLCTVTIAWVVYALHVILLDGLGTWTGDLLAVQNRIGISTISLSVLAIISLALKLSLLKQRKKQLGGGLSSS